MISITLPNIVCSLINDMDLYFYFGIDILLVQKNPGKSVVSHISLKKYQVFNEAYQKCRLRYFYPFII